MFSNLSAEQAAKKLLGFILIRSLPNGEIWARITETESYSQDDPAAHSYRGPTARTKSMFGRSGHTYVYFIYGNHYCLNIVTGPEGVGDAVLVRSTEIIKGRDLALKNRNGRQPISVGPGRLAESLQITREFDGHDLTKSPLILKSGRKKKNERIAATKRIGIRHSKELPLRFVLERLPD